MNLLYAISIPKFIKKIAMKNNISIQRWAYDKQDSLKKDLRGISQSIDNG